MEVFFTLIFAVLLVGANFYMRPEYLTLAISDIKFNYPVPTSDSTEITAGGFKVRLEGPVPLDAKRVLIVFLISAFYL